MKLTPLIIIMGYLLSSYAYANKNIYKCVEPPTGKKSYQSGTCAEGQINNTLNIETGDSIDLDELQKQQNTIQQKEQSKQEEQKLSKQQLIEKQEAINKEAIAESAATQILIKSDPKQFSAFAIPPYVPNNLTELVKPHQERLPDIERLRRVAAQKALATNLCNRVEASELDVKSTKILLSFLINCSSGKAFYYTEQDLK